MKQAIRRTHLGLCAAALLALGAPQAAAQCTDDYLEDNDSCGQPTLVYGGFGATLTSVYGDDDFYQVHVGDGEDLTVDLTFQHSLGDIDLYLFDTGCGTQLASSLSVTDDESVAYSNTSGAGQDLVFQVHKYAPNPDIMCNDYGLAVVVTTTVDCQDDPELGNQDNDSCGDANLVFSDAVYLQLGVLDVDPDYYKITVPVGNTLYVDLTFQHILGDIDMVLYDSTCTNALAQATSVDDDESLFWTNTSGVPVEVKWNVYLYSGQCNQYHMVASLANEPCGPDDSFEDNDSCVMAAPLGVGSFPNLIVDGTDPDFFSFQVLQGEVLDIDTLFSHSAGDVDLLLWDSCGGALLASSTSTTDDESVSWNNVSGPDTDVYLEVLLYGGVGCNSYEILANITNAQPGVNFCTSLPNSTGSAALMSAQGSASVVVNDLVLVAQPLPANQNGIFYYGPNQIQVPFGNGFRCVGGTVYRLPVRNSGTAGVLSFAVDYGLLPPAGPIAPGSAWNFQAWFRDPMGGGAAFNLSDGYRITFLP